MGTEAWIAIATAFISGGGLTALTGYFQSHYKDRQRGQLEERQQIFEQQIGIVERLEKRLDKSELERKEEIEKIVLKLEKCQEGHAKCEREQGILEGQIKVLTAFITKHGDEPMVVVTDQQLKSIEVEGK